MARLRTVELVGARPAGLEGAALLPAWPNVDQAHVPLRALADKVVADGSRTIREDDRGGSTGLYRKGGGVIVHVVAGGNGEGWIGRAGCAAGREKQARHSKRGSE